MAAHGFPWNDRGNTGKRSPLHWSARMLNRTHAPRRIELPNYVETWLESLPPDVRYASSSCLGELADRVVYTQVKDRFQRANLVRVAGFVSDLAQSHLEGATHTRFVEVALLAPRVIELGLIIALAQLSGTRGIPRDQGYYPAVLFDREVLSIVKHAAERDQPAVALLWTLASAHDPVLAQNIETSMKDVARGFAKTPRWPNAHESMTFRHALSQLMPRWKSLADKLIEATTRGDGTLPMLAVEQAAKPLHVSRVETRLLVDAINRRRQKRSPADLLCMAMQWPIRAGRVVDNLAGDLGSLRLYSAYVCAIWSGVFDVAQRCQQNLSTFVEHAGELFERDIAHPIAAGVEPSQTMDTLFEDASSYDTTRKKRLSRQRERCLHAGLGVMDVDWIDLLREIRAACVEGVGLDKPVFPRGVTGGVTGENRVVLK